MESNFFLNQQPADGLQQLSKTIPLFALFSTITYTSLAYFGIYFLKGGIAGLSG
jgi:hypothetical protein